MERFGNRAHIRTCSCCRACTGSFTSCNIRTRPGLRKTSQRKKNRSPTARGARAFPLVKGWDKVDFPDTVHAVHIVPRVHTIHGLWLTTRTLKLTTSDQTSKSQM